MRTKVFLLVVAAFVGWGALWGCAPTETAHALHIFDGASMGTTYAVRVVTADNWDQPRRDRIKDLEARASERGVPCVWGQAPPEEPMINPQQQELPLCVACVNREGA